MTKITAEHLGRGAFVYVRQSTADQLVHNQESPRRQYGLAYRARQLGWTAVEVIDDDLGRTRVEGGVERRRRRRKGAPYYASLPADRALNERPRRSIQGGRG